MTTVPVINQAGLALVKYYEGLKLVAYRDIAGIWTIGYGHTGGVYKGQVVTEDQATQLLFRDLANAEDFVYARAPGSSSNQFSAMVSLAFNIGNKAFLGSSVLRFHKDGLYASAADAFLLFDKAHVDGVLVTVGGLLARRNSERTLYLSPMMEWLS